MKLIKCLTSRSLDSNYPSVYVYKRKYTYKVQLIEDGGLMFAMIKTAIMAFSNFKKWAAYTKGFELASSIFLVSKTFPKAETYSLTDQIRRSSRSVCANLAQAFWKRRYPKHFVTKITDSAGENAETQVWLDAALVAGYLTKETHKRLTLQSEEVGKILTYMMKNPGQFELRQ